MITDNLPFPDLYDILANDIYLIKYLMLSLPFHHNNIENAINLLIYMLQDKPNFFRNFFVGVTEVVMLQKKDKDSDANGQNSIRKARKVPQKAPT
jgi:hypothetical protein